MSSLNAFGGEMKKSAVSLIIASSNASQHYRNSSGEKIDFSELMDTPIEIEMV